MSLIPGAAHGVAPQHLAGEVLEPVRAGRHAPVAHQQSADHVGRHQVAAVERAAEVVLQHDVRDASLDGFVRVPVAGVVAHDQLGSFADALAVVDLARRDRSAAPRRAAVSGSVSASSFAFSSRASASACAPGWTMPDSSPSVFGVVLLAAGEVQVQTVEADAVGARLRPIGRVEDVTS